MSREKLIIPGHAAPGLIVEGRQSRMAMFALECECACPTVLGEEKIERIRMADGRWVKAETIVRRLESLGLRFIDAKLEGAGPHTPVWSGRAG